MEKVASAPSSPATVTNDADEARFAVFEFVFVADDDAAVDDPLHLRQDPVRRDDQRGLPGLRQDVPTGYDLIQVQEITR